MSNKIPISELIPTLKKGMQGYGLGEANIYMHVKALMHLYDFMEANNIEAYDEEIGKKYYSMVFNDANLSVRRKTYDRRSILMLNLIISGKPYTRAIGRTSVVHTPPETELGRYVVEFLKVVEEQHYSYATLASFRRCLSYFSKAMRAAEITVKDLCHESIMEYISQLPKGRIQMAIAIRKFLGYLFAQNITAKNLSLGLYRIKEFRSTPVMTFYCPSEVQKIEAAVDRTTAIGKKDYAIILLATRLGLRSSDIRQLKFSDLDWDRNEIRITQYKTGRKIVLPLLAEVGEALIDYIRNGRPSTDGIKEIFVANTHPYSPYKSISNVTSKYIRKAEIEVNGRHRGLHSLRHSLATAMMNEGNEVSVISAALGHRSSESTT